MTQINVLSICEYTEKVEVGNTKKAKISIESCSLTPRKIPDVKELKSRFCMSWIELGAIFRI